MKVIFLDRDGVINEFPGNGKYVTKLKDFHFIPGSLEAIRLLTEKKYSIFVVSNQAGVGKGVYTQKKLDHINSRMLAAVRKNGGRIRKVFYCTHRSDYGCNCRKPEIGSILKGLKLLGKSIRSARHSYFVGDTEADIKAGFNAGCKTVFVLSGREDCLYMRRWDDVEPDYIFYDLKEAVLYITGEGKVKPLTRNSKVARTKCNSRRREIGINLKRRSSD